MEAKQPRLLYLMDYLNTQTDEQHPATVTEISDHLKQAGYACGWKSVKRDIEQLMNGGVDVVCNKGRECKYFVGSRHFELVELKMLVDAVQASRFISHKKSQQLIEKLAGLASIHQAGQLNRHLYVDKQTKTSNEQVFYTADLLHEAIREGRKVSFKYYEYNSRKQKVYKHNRRLYCLSPYTMLWNNDCYYVLGYSDSHGKVATFRVDRIAAPELCDEPAVPAPEGFDPSVYSKSVFQMYDGAEQAVTLKCENTLMKSVIDRFGEDVETSVLDEGHFSARVHVSASPTFFGWVFSFVGKMEIIAPQIVADEYIALAHLVAEKAR